MSVDISAIFGQRKKQAEAERAQAARAAGGRLWTVPDDFPDIQAAIDNAAPGDGIFLVPGASPFILSDPLSISKPLHILGVDDVGASAVIRFETGVHYLPLLRVSSSNVRMKGVTLEATYSAPDEQQHLSNGNPRTSTEGGASTNKHARALPPLDPASPRYVSVQVGSGAQNVVFDECVLRCRGGMHGLFLSPESYTTLICCSFSSISGCALYSDGRVYVDRCDFSDSALGLMISQNSHAQVKASCFTKCDQGMVIDGHGFAEANVCAFSCCRVGVVARADLPPPKVSVLHGCEFADCALTAIFIGGVEAALDVQKNFFHGTCAHGVAIHQSSQRVEVRANAFRDLSGLGVRVVAGAPIVECNVFDKCRGGGVLVESSRPTIRLNEFVRNRRHVGVTTTGALQSPHVTRRNCSIAVMVDGESVSTGSFDAVSAAMLEEHIGATIVAGAQPHAQSGGGRIVQSERANPVLACRSAVAASNHALVHVMRPHPDPHVEGNLFAENDVNLWVTLGSGTFVKNELLSSFEQSVVVEGAESVQERSSSHHGEDDRQTSKPASPWRNGAVKPTATAPPTAAVIDATFRLPEFPASISHNELRGSVSSHVVQCLPGAFACLIQNEISHAAKGFGVLLEHPRFVELKQNTLGECQGGIQVRGEGSTGKVVNNNLQGLSLYIQSDAVQTMLVANNINAQDVDGETTTEA